MASIDLTLNGIKIPAISGYTPPFGTKKSSGGLSTREVNDNVIAPFEKERPITITETSATGNVEYNANLVINSANAVLTLGSGTYVGCTVQIMAKTAASVSYNSGSTYTLVAGNVVRFIWSGSEWFTDKACPINSSRHEVSLGGVTATVKAYYRVVNGWCIISSNSYTPSDTGPGQILISNVPKAKERYWGADTVGQLIYIYENSTNVITNITTLNARYMSIIYPVADDWVEPAS